MKRIIIIVFFMLLFCNISSAVDYTAKIAIEIPHGRHWLIGFGPEWKFSKHLYLGFDIQSAYYKYADGNQVPLLLGGYLKFMGSDPSVRFFGGIGAGVEIDLNESNSNNSLPLLNLIGGIEFGREGKLIKVFEINFVMVPFAGGELLIRGGVKW